MAKKKQLPAPAPAPAPQPAAPAPAPTQETPAPGAPLLDKLCEWGRKAKEAAVAAAKLAYQGGHWLVKGALWLVGVETMDDAEKLVVAIRGWVAHVITCVAETIAQQAGDVIIRLIVLKIVSACGGTVAGFAQPMAGRPGPAWAGPGARWANQPAEAPCGQGGEDV